MNGVGTQENVSLDYFCDVWASFICIFWGCFFFCAVCYVVQLVCVLLAACSARLCWFLGVGFLLFGYS